MRFAIVYDHSVRQEVQNKGRTTYVQVQHIESTKQSEDT